MSEATFNSNALFDLPPIQKRKRTNNKAAINRWKQEHRIITHYNRNMQEPWTALAPKLTMEDVADRYALLEETGEMVFGRTEQEACELIAENCAILIPWQNASVSHRARSEEDVVQQRLVRLLSEAGQIVSRHDGVHLVHECWCAINNELQWIGMYDDHEVDWAHMDLVMAQLRYINKFGQRTPRNFKNAPAQAPKPAP